MYISSSKIRQRETWSDNHIRPINVPQKYIIGAKHVHVHIISEIIENNMIHVGLAIHDELILLACVEVFPFEA